MGLPVGVLLRSVILTDKSEAKSNELSSSYFFFSLPEAWLAQQQKLRPPHSGSSVFRKNEWLPVAVELGSWPFVGGKGGASLGVPGL